MLVSGTGEVLSPDDDVLAVGSGSVAALAAARTLLRHTELGAEEIVREALAVAAEIDIYTNDRTNCGGAGAMSLDHLTPREIVAELDRYIVGQHDAKRAVAVALRNRWRRQQLSPELRDEVAPKNIIMIGPTGVGKTEIARRLARLTGSPFLKVEASKFTEVGYVGRDVESIVRDLVEAGVQLVRSERVAEVKVRAERATEDRLLELSGSRGQRRAVHLGRTPTVGEASVA